VCVCVNFASTKLLILFDFTTHSSHLILAAVRFKGDRALNVQGLRS